MEPEKTPAKSGGAMAAGLGLVALIIGLVVGYGVTAASKNNTISDLKSENSSMMHESGSGSGSTASASTDGVTVGGAKMVQDKDIVDNAVNAKNVTTVVAAVKAAGLVDTLKGAGPFTVFAPNNDAFAALPAGTVDTLLKPENKSMLASILTYHVVAGTYTTADLKVMATKGETLTSVQGGVLTPVLVDNQVEIQDAKGNKVMIETPNIISSNGVTHVIKSVLMSN